jgi:hypothetical protein
VARAARVSMARAKRCGTRGAPIAAMPSLASSCFWRSRGGASRILLPMAATASAFIGSIREIARIAGPQLQESCPSSTAISVGRAGRAAGPISPRSRTASSRIGRITAIQGCSAAAPRPDRGLARRPPRVRGRRRRPRHRVSGGPGSRRGSCSDSGPARPAAGPGGRAPRRRPAPPPPARASPGYSRSGLGAVGGYGGERVHPQQALEHRDRRLRLGPDRPQADERAVRPVAPRPDEVVDPADQGRDGGSRLGPPRGEGVRGGVTRLERLRGEIADVVLEPAGPDRGGRRRGGAPDREGSASPLFSPNEGEKKAAFSFLEGEDSPNSPASLRAPRASCPRCPRRPPPGPPAEAPPPSPRGRAP